MTRYTLTFLEEHRVALQAILLKDDFENAALLLCGQSRQVDPWTGDEEKRFLIKDIIEVEPTAFLERTPVKLTWSTTPFYNALKRADRCGMAVAVAHSHPSGPLAFSTSDDAAEGELLQIAVNRQESDVTLLSVIMDRQGELIARAYETDLKPRRVEMIRVIGQRWRFLYEGGSRTSGDAEFDRQIRAFGRRSTEDLGALRIGVVGCGGTGSAVASLLARIGVRRVALFDPDRIDETSLGRVHFSSREDANLGRLKVDVVGRGVARLGLSVAVLRFPYYADDERCRDALRSCDILFGCTDDHLGRNLLNRLAHFYLIPVVDLGVLIEPRDDGTYDSFDGRVTVVQPGYPCQHCRSLIQSERMLAEHLRRHDPVLFRERRRAGYITNSDEPNPVVVTFTTELAALAVNEVFQRLTGFRGADGSIAERIRRFDEIKNADRVPGGIRRPQCTLCGLRKYDGRGDMMPFLDQA